MSQAHIQHLRNAPIVEAVIDLQVAFDNPPSPDSLRLLHAEVKDQYPLLDEQKQAQIQVGPFGFTTPPVQQIDATVRGYLFLPHDRLEIIQFRRDGFTFNRLRPYTSFDDVFEKTTRAWRIYREHFPDGRLTRIGMRYINQFQLPFFDGRLSVDEYIRTGLVNLDVPNVLVTNFISHCSLIDPATGFTGAWTLSRLQPPTPGILGIVIKQNGKSCTPILRTSWEPVKRWSLSK
jgi:uncharacterized protein (TIGR04255 family)